jgi:DNA-binding response OmpR family regulator
MMERLQTPHQPDVLLVEDDAELRNTLAWLFDEEAIPFRLACSGDEAIDAARQARPAVVLLDLTLPGMPAQEFVQLLRASPTLADVPVVVLSAVRDIAARAREIGADDALAKPYDIDAVLSVVRTHAQSAAWAQR